MATKTTLPAPATPAVEPAAAPTPAPAPDIGDVAQDSAVKAMLSTQPKKKDKPEAKPAGAPAEPAAPAAPAQPAPAAAPAAPATVVTKPALKVRKPQPPKPALDSQTIADAVAAGVSKVLPKPAEPIAEVVQLPDHLAANKPIYDQLESMNPKYKGVTKKMADFAQKEINYATQWEDRERARLVSEGKASEAQDVAYNADDPQHALFYDRNAPKIDPGDLKRAEFNAMYEDLRKAEKSGKEDEVGALKKEISNLKAAPEARHAVEQFGANLVHTLNPEGGELTPAKFQQWAEANPIESEVAAQMREQVMPVVHAASLLWDGAIDFDQNNEAHTVAAATFNRFEQALASQPEPVTDERGRTWVPIAEFSKLPKSQQGDFFTTTKQALVSYIALNTAQQVKTIAQHQRETIERNATRLGYQKPQVPPVTPQASATVPAKPAPALASPSVGGGAPIAPSTGVAPAPKIEGGSTVGGLLGVR